MTKSKNNVEIKLKMNHNNNLTVGKEIDKNFRKSTRSKESAMLPGLGSEEH